MRRVTMVAAAALALGMIAGPSFADQHNGQGKNAPGGPDPVDYTSTLPNLLGPDSPVLVSAGETTNGGLGVAVAVGDEGEPNSIGRVGVAAGDSEQLADSELGSVYFEDYTTGDQIANLIEAVNKLTGCILVGVNPCSPSQDDAGRTDINLLILQP